MIGLLKLTPEQRKTVFEQAAQIANIPAKAVEKDWWVTLTLKALFMSKHKEHLVFKGGTSLSKCWRFIERFSEDIDIGLAPEAFGMSHEEQPTNAFLKKLKQSGYEFTNTKIKPELEQQFLSLGIPAGMITITEEERKENTSYPDPQTLYLTYPSLFEKNIYLADLVKIEISVRTLKEPKTKIAIESVLYEVFPNEAYKEDAFEVTVVEAHRTFLEKMFLLHEEFQKPDITKIKSERMSRHFYDLERMMDKVPGEKALADKELYDLIIKHRTMYNTVPGIDYTTHAVERISFLPPLGLIDAYGKDYATMKEVMIHGESLDFKNLMIRLIDLLSRYKGLAGKDVLKKRFEPVSGKFIRWWEDDKEKGKGRIFARAIIDYITDNKFTISVSTYISYGKTEQYGIDYSADRIEIWTGKIAMENWSDGIIVWEQKNPNNNGTGFKRIKFNEDLNSILLIGEKEYGLELFTEREN